MVEHGVLNEGARHMYLIWTHSHFMVLYLSKRRLRCVRSAFNVLNEKHKVHQTERGKEKEWKKEIMYCKEIQAFLRMLFIPFRNERKIISVKVLQYAIITRPSFRFQRFFFFRSFCMFSIFFCLLLRYYCFLVK